MRSLPRSLGILLQTSTLAAAAFLGGCGEYNSDYVPIQDGRARAVFRNDNLVMEVGGGIAPGCADAPNGPLNLGSGSYGPSDSGVRVWVPVYYGPRIVVVNRGVAPPPHRPAYRPHSSSGLSGGGSGGSFNGITSGGGGSTSGGSSGGGGGNLDLKEGVVILAVIALIALPAISLGLALGHPENETEVATAIDRVNMYNDMARTPGSPCYAYAAPAPEGPAQ